MSETTARTWIDDRETLVGQFGEYEPIEDGFGTAFIDIDEWRDTPRRHRYVHGGFADTNTRFSMYLPPDEHFGGRILKHLEGGSGGNENLFVAAGIFAPPWQFDFAYDEFGAILMESNQGHFPTEGMGFHNDVWLFGASAECARFAKWLANELYGRPVHHTYVFGASGGGHRSYQCLMHRGDVFDGGVPEVCGVNPGPYWSIQALAGELLGDRLAAVGDACEPGGGDPFDGLTFDQREALADLFRYGYPMPAMNQLQTLAAPFTLYNSLEDNPGYFEDFWTKPGYLGHDDPDRLAGRRVSITTTFTEIATADDLREQPDAGALSLLLAGAAPLAALGAKVDVPDPDRIYMSFLTVKTGKAAGRTMVASQVINGYVLPFAQRCPELYADIEPGDEVEIDNRHWLAFTYLYKHSVENNVPGLHRDDQRVPSEYGAFAIENSPVHAQTSEIVYDLNELTPFDSKMIVVACALDSMIWPSKISPLARHFAITQGDRLDDTFRLWWVDNATHGPPEFGAMMSSEHNPAVWRTRLVDYSGPAKRALLDVAAWVEDGIAPTASSAYSFSPSNQLQLPVAGDERGGIQPSVRLEVDGGVRADVKVGQVVRLTGRAEMPIGSGRIARAEIDFVSDDTWPFQHEIDGGDSEVVDVDTTHAFTEPGTYFPSFRVSSWREGADGRGLPVQNLARVRVVVTA